MVSIIMLTCAFVFIGGLIAIVNALIQKKKKKALIWLGIVVSSTVIYQTIGTTYWTKNPPVAQQETQEDGPSESQQDEEPEIKKEQYDVVWGTYDNEWVYSDDWTGEGFENFDEAMNVLNQCMTESEEETENCVYDYLKNK